MISPSLEVNILIVAVDRPESSTRAVVHYQTTFSDCQEVVQQSEQQLDFIAHVLKSYERLLRRRTRTHKCRASACVQSAHSMPDLRTANREVTRSFPCANHSAPFPYNSFESENFMSKQHILLRYSLLSNQRAPSLQQSNQEAPSPPAKFKHFHLNSFIPQIWDGESPCDPYSNDNKRI
ncbi:hypothetical protein TNCV_3392741 [Trichonephila clavipes]|nr:hypothetical protein TNCV_3392741 [Trichonephila clavipes]